MFCKLLHVRHVVQNKRCVLSLSWHERFSCEGKEWKIYRWGLALSSEPQKSKFHVVVWQTTSKTCTKKRAARAARLFFLVQPVKQLICGDVVAVVIFKLLNTLTSHKELCLAARLFLVTHWQILILQTHCCSMLAVGCAKSNDGRIINENLVFQTSL